MTMQYRRLGRTGLHVSVVGFGTNELRLLTPTQAIDSLLRSFDLGVNLVHTAPDYEGAEELVAEAVARTPHKVIVASQAYDIHYNTHGPVAHFESHFEATCQRLNTDRLELYGIAAVDDREAFEENVWGRYGMIEFLLKMKDQGRIGSIFCTNHGAPHHMRKLIESDVFDALMISCNPLGYHLLTLNPPPSRHFEDVEVNCAEIVPLCRQRDIGVMAMMPLAGGLIVDSKAFPPRDDTARAPSRLNATIVLRSILQDEGIASVVPGTASVEEAEENARAGHLPITIDPHDRDALFDRITELRASLCNRCGACEPLCSQHLPISWLFRASEMSKQPAEAFETWREVDYFRLHPQMEATCVNCRDITCACPSGIQIPQKLTAAHAHMRELLDRGLVAPPLEDSRANRGGPEFGARILSVDIPNVLAPGVTSVCRLHLENIGGRGWFPQSHAGGGVLLRVFVNDAVHTEACFRQDVHQGGRGYLVFELTGPIKIKRCHLRLELLGAHTGYVSGTGIEILSQYLPLQGSGVQHKRAENSPRRLYAWLDGWLGAVRR